MRLFQKQGHKIIHGDTSLVLKTEIEPETVDLIFIDPPYNIGKQFSNFHDNHILQKELFHDASDI